MDIRNLAPPPESTDSTVQFDVLEQYHEAIRRPLGT